MKNAHSTKPPYGLSTIKGFIYQSFNSLLGFDFSKVGNGYNVATISENIICATFFIGNF